MTVNGEFTREIIDLKRTGEQIRSLREAHGLSAEELGNLIGVTKFAVYRWEEGRSLPDTAIVPSLCKLLRVTAEELFVCN